jgi:HEPN domain-containing protein
MANQPEVCMRSAVAWLSQAKADFCAAQSLFIIPAGGAGPTRCDFPALVCFLCHDTAEKSIKGVLYAFCGLRQELVMSSNLVKLHNDLDSSPHRPEALMSSIKECVMIVNRHENRSRFPNYHDPLCAPAAVYTLKDAQEAFAATEKLLQCLQSHEKFQEVLDNLSNVPTITPNPLFQSRQSLSGICHTTNYVRSLGYLQELSQNSYRVSLPIGMLLY